MSAVVLVGGKILTSGGSALGLPVPNALLQLPNYASLYGNTYVAGTTGSFDGQIGSPPADLPVGIMVMLSENANPAQTNGFYLSNTWDAGAYTGVTPVNSTGYAQLSVAATGTSPSSTFQWEGSQLGVIMFGSDMAAAANRPMFTPQINFTDTIGSGPVLFTDSSVTMTESITIECPTWVGSGSPETNANSPYIQINLGLVGPGLVAGDAWEIILSIFITQGAGESSAVHKSYVAQGGANAYQFLVPVNAASSSSYITFTSGSYYNGTFPTQTVSWSISYTQFQNILNYMAAQGWGSNPAFPSGTTPSQFTLNQAHVNAEMPNVSTISLGWSMSAWTIVTT
jgi:hypothetical protein